MSAVWTSGEVLRRCTGARAAAVADVVGGGVASAMFDVIHGGGVGRVSSDRDSTSRYEHPAGELQGMRRRGVPDHRLARRAHTSTRVPDYRIIAEKSSCESVKRAVRVSLREFIRELILDRAAFFVKVCEV